MIVLNFRVVLIFIYYLHMDFIEKLTGSLSEIGSSTFKSILF